MCLSWDEGRLCGKDTRDTISHVCSADRFMEVVATPGQVPATDSSNKTGTWASHGEPPFRASLRVSQPVSAHRVSVSRGLDGRPASVVVTPPYLACRSRVLPVGTHGRVCQLHLGLFLHQGRQRLLRGRWVGQGTLAMCVRCVACARGVTHVGFGQGLIAVATRYCIVAAVGLSRTVAVFRWCPNLCPMQRVRATRATRSAAWRPPASRLGMWAASAPAAPRAAWRTSGKACNRRRGVGVGLCRGRRA